MQFMQVKVFIGTRTKFVVLNGKTQNLFEIFSRHYLPNFIKIHQYIYRWKSIGYDVKFNSLRFRSYYLAFVKSYLKLRRLK